MTPSTSGLIAGLTPEQVLTCREPFERKMREEYGDQWTFALQGDGFSYAEHDVDRYWEGFLFGFAHFLGQDLRTTNRHAEDLLRVMRQKSKCFTGAFDKQEPVFVLRAQDETAYRGIAQWVASNTPSLGANHPKIIAAKATIGAFLDWPNKKRPD